MEQAARVVSLMDSDDAVDLLENLEDEDKKEIVEHLDEEAERMSGCFCHMTMMK